MVGPRHIALAPLATAILLDISSRPCLVANAEAVTATAAVDAIIDGLSAAKTADPSLLVVPNAILPIDVDAEEHFVSASNFEHDPAVGLLGAQNSQRGSGENYGKLLSKSRDFEHLPEMHPARLHAEARATKRRSFHLVLAGFVLATAYLLLYFYHTSGSGLRTHTERHNFALNRMSSPSSAIFWLVAWRLWLGFVVSGLVSLLLNIYHIEKMAHKKKRLLPKWFVALWELLVGLPLLLLILSTGQATQRAAVELGSAVGPAGGVLGKVFSHSGTASNFFLFDMIQQVPFGLVVVGIVELLTALFKGLRQPTAKNTPMKKQQRSSSGGSTVAEEDLSRSATFTASTVDGEFLDDQESPRQASITSRKRTKKERTRKRRRTYNIASRAVGEEPSQAEDQPEPEDPVASQTTASIRRLRRVRGSERIPRSRNTSMRLNRLKEARRRPLEEGGDQDQDIQEGE